MSRRYRFVVGTQDADRRLDRYLVRHLPRAVSRTAVQRAIAAGAITVDGHAAKAHRHLKAGEHVLAQFEQLAAPSQHAVLIPESIPLAIVYEDEQLLVVNKPAGLVTHPAPGHWAGTLVNAVLGHFQSDIRHQTSDVSLPRAGIVHRLDKDTSGLLLVAKTGLALRELAAQLKTRTMSRRYLALVEGVMPHDEGTIDAAIGRHLKDRKRMTVRYLGGRDAVTHYRVLKRFNITATGSDIRHQTSDQRLKNGNRDIPEVSSLQSLVSCPQPPFSYTLLEVSLKTGRTHQVRVHLGHLGHPVLGDVVYGRHPASHWQAWGIARQLLHAYAIRFVHPTTRQPIELTATLPADMVRWCADGAHAIMSLKGEEAR